MGINVAQENIYLEYKNLKIWFPKYFRKFMLRRYVYMYLNQVIRKFGTRQSAPRCHCFASQIG